MKVKYDKVTGYILLSIGVAMIIFSVYSMFNVFSGSQSPPDLFDFSDISIPFPQVEGGSETVQIISGEEMNKFTGLGTWYLLMFFIVFAGGKIASLGVNLIKEVRVEMKS